MAQWCAPYTQDRNDPSSNPGRAVCLCYCLKSGVGAKSLFKMNKSESMYRSIKWASPRENLSSGFPKERDSN